MPRNGNVEKEVEGVKGTHCLELTQAIEQQIGIFEQKLLKNDFYRKGEIIASYVITRY